MFRRGQYRQFKYFFAYIIAQLVSFGIIFPIRHNYSAFFYANWISTAISVGARFQSDS